MEIPHVVVIGAGFAGLNAARALIKDGYRVTLVDRHPYTTFQPLLYQVATGGLNPGDVTHSLRSLAARHRSRMRFRRASVTDIDTENRRVIVDAGEPLAYDHVVLAQGVGASFFGIPGAREYARSIYTRAEALEVRDVIFGQLERLTTEDQHQRLVTVVVGGGATGVEMAGALAEMKSIGLPIAYPEINPARVEVILVEMGPTLLPPFDESLRDYTLRQLQHRGVDVRLNTAIKEVRPGEVTFADETTQQADLVIWAAGVGGHDAVKEWGVPQGRGGRVVVDDALRVQGHERMYAVGDAALIESSPLPQLAQPAMQMGAHVAGVIKAVEEGREPEAFHYTDKGTMATIGRSAAVVQLKQGPKFTGLIAWVMWVVLHLYFLLGGRNRIQAMINLGARYLLYPRNANAIVGDLGDSPSQKQLRGENPGSQT
ncbi:NAD(P)/FAD-dependent oxidoreductase [Mariniluteicoccus flavus]